MKPPIRKSIVAAALLVFGIVLALWCFFRWGHSPADDQIRILYSLSIQNTTNRPITASSIGVYGPILRTATQHCTDIQTSHPHELTKDKLGSQSLAFQWDIFPPLSTKIVTVKSDIKIWNKPQRDETLAIKDFLHPEPLIESDDRQIRIQAEKLKAKRSLKTVENTFEWVANHIVYNGYVSRNRGAAYALKYGKGDCTEYAFLFVALCRANGIPARPLAGFVCPQSMVVDFGDYHNWAEFYLDGRWHIADPQNKRFMSNTPYYIAFQNIRPSKGQNGFLIYKVDGVGLEVKLKPRDDSANQRKNTGSQ
jgi:hypothetical protein